ncbi:unnamed protein product [Rangifer tarandus platyrhynchus]|uniref:Uncharacterized protein n=1 Tax=Rangifer tarandus platyrhynchus TaxID=3082113 RepID=A0AC59Y738_RANTA
MALMPSPQQPEWGASLPFSPGTLQPSASHLAPHFADHRAKTPKVQSPCCGTKQAITMRSPPAAARQSSHSPSAVATLRHSTVKNAPKQSGKRTGNGPLDLVTRTSHRGLCWEKTES